MGQVTIYLEDEIEKKMIASAKAMNLSKSKWIANIIREKLVEEWPAAVREMPGTWGDFPSTDEFQTQQSLDIEREKL